jgi:hypothetical protein
MANELHVTIIPITEGKTAVNCLSYETYHIINKNYKTININDINKVFPVCEKKKYKMVPHKSKHMYPFMEKFITDDNKLNKQSIIKLYYKKKDSDNKDDLDLTFIEMIEYLFCHVDIYIISCETVLVTPDEILYRYDEEYDDYHVCNSNCNNCNMSGPNIHSIENLTKSLESRTITVGSCEYFDSFDPDELYEIDIVINDDTPRYIKPLQKPIVDSVSSKSKRRRIEE